MQSSSASSAAGVLVQHLVPGFSEDWLIGEPVPEAAWHDRTVELFRALLEHWVSRTRRDAVVFRNLAIRVREDRPKVGFDPDLALVAPAPPAARSLSSLRIWEPEHAVPRLVVEVVSPGHPFKDYSDIPDRCAAVGVHELIVFDPELVGPKSLGGPKLLQLWRRTEAGVFTRVATGDGPYASEVLGAYVFVGSDGALRIADQPDGGDAWQTATEAALAEKDEALARVAQLEAELSKRGK